MPCVSDGWIMWDNGNREARPRHVQFANGFPPKGLVAQALSRNTVAYNMHGGVFSGLDDMSPQVGNLHRTIPPLAKGRGQFCSAKTRDDNNRYKRRSDPFRLHKPAEKTSFSAYPIKHARPKPTRPCQPPKPRTAQRPPPTPFSFKSLARKSVYASAVKVGDSDRMLSLHDPADVCGNVVSTTPDPGRTRNFRLLSDVEKEFIQAELVGLEEVYQRICHGNTESLYSLLYPGHKSRKRVPVQYIHTSSPLLLRSCPKSSHQRKPEDKFTQADVAREQPTEKTTELNSRVGYLTSNTEQVVNRQDKVRPILIPLPFFASEKSLQSIPLRHQKSQHDSPLVYTTKHAGKKSAGLPCSAAAVINFNPMIQQRAKNAAPTGAIVGVQNRCSTGKLAVVAALPGHAPPPTPTLYSCIESSKDSVAHEQLGSDQDVGVTKVDSGTLELESVGSEGSELNGSQTFDQNQNGDRETEEKSRVETESLPALNLTTDDGQNGGVEIYNSANRDMEEEKRASVEIQALQTEGEKKMKEFETLLEEHKSIVNMVYELEKELKETS